MPEGRDLEQMVGRSYRNANQLDVRGQIIRLMRSSNRGRWLRATAASPRAGSEEAVTLISRQPPDPRATGRHPQHDAEDNGRISMIFGSVA